MHNTKLAYFKYIIDPFTYFHTSTTIDLTLHAINYILNHFNIINLYMNDTFNLRKTYNFTCYQIYLLIICDVMLMKATYILLGKPWQYDRKVIYKGFHNVYTLYMD